MNRILIAAIVIVIAACVGFYFWAESEKARFDASLPELSAVEEQQVIDNTVEDDTAGDTVDDTAGGHWHGDEWHAEPHRDALPDKGMHFADQQDLTGAPVTGAEQQGSLTYVLPPGTSPAEASQVNEAYKKWHREVWQPAHDEWWEMSFGESRPLGLRLQGEEFVEYFTSLSETEHEKAVAEMEAHIEKREAAWERLKAVERSMPDFVAEVLGGE